MESEQIEVRGPAQLTDLLTLLSEASLSSHRILRAGQLDDLKELVHCYWIPAGGYTKAPEIHGLRGDITLVTENVG